MPTIELSQGNFEALQELAEPLVDTPDSVVGRLIDSYQNDHDGRTEGDKTREGEQARRGEKTPTEAFYGPIIEVLEEADGELKAGEAVDRVGEKTEDELNDVDRAELKSGEIRWRNTVRFARLDLVKRGQLDPDSPFGVWQLADQNSN